MKSFAKYLFVILSSPLYGILSGLICLVLAFYSGLMMALYSNILLEDFIVDSVINAIPILSDIVELIHLINMAFTNFSATVNNVLAGWGLFGFFVLVIMAGYFLSAKFAKLGGIIIKDSLPRFIICILLVVSSLMLIVHLVPYDDLIDSISLTLPTITLRHKQIAISYYVIAAIHVALFLGKLSEERR